MDVQMLHAVRIGFCKKIEDGSITLNVAAVAFEHLLQTVVEKAQKEQEQDQRNKKL